jgi:acetyl-CoA carboxylase carboxyl transferase subunit beta
MPWPVKKHAGLDASEKQSFGKGVFRRCEGCAETMPAEKLVLNFEVCPACGQHHKLPIHRWRELLLDDGHLTEWDAGVSPKDPLHFSDGKPYIDRIAGAQRASGSADAIETGQARMNGVNVAFGVFNFAFMGGSMGSVVGEKKRLPVVLLQASVGARMQEGILSLMQMAKTVGARERLRDARVPFISVLLHPTTGGVAASFAFLGDVNIAEPKALIGFAGARVIETTIRQTLPDGFQRSEFLRDHGMVDRITSRLEMKEEISRLLRLLVGQERLRKNGKSKERKSSSELPETD